MRSNLAGGTFKEVHHHNDKANLFKNNLLKVEVDPSVWVNVILVNRVCIVLGKVSLSSLYHQLQVGAISFCKHRYNNSLYWKSNWCIPRNETARPCSQFLHSCICERFIYFQDRSVFLVSAKSADRSWHVYIAHRYMNVEIGRQNIVILLRGMGG